MFTHTLTALSQRGYRGLGRVGSILLLLALAVALSAAQMHSVSGAAAAAPEPSTNYLLIFVVALLLHAPIVIGLLLAIRMLVRTTIDQNCSFSEGTVYPQYCLLYRR